MLGKCRSSSSSKFDQAVRVNALGAVLEAANGSNGSSSSSSSGLVDERRLETGVVARGMYERSGVRGAAIARFELVRVVLCAQRSGDGVSARKADKEVGFEDAADSGLGIGLNSLAFAFRSRGDDRGDEGMLALKCDWKWDRTGEADGDSPLWAIIHDEGWLWVSGDAAGVCGLLNT
jgi:hypothetical protein